jgi:hypothetical protein
MMGYATTQDWAEGALLPPRGRWGLTEAAVVKAVASSPPPTTDKVDRIYCQLTEIHAIDVT